MHEICVTGNKTKTEKAELNPGCSVLCTKIKQQKNPNIDAVNGPCKSDVYDQQRKCFLLLETKLKTFWKSKAQNPVTSVWPRENSSNTETKADCDTSLLLGLKEFCAWKKNVFVKNIPISFKSLGSHLKGSLMYTFSMQIFTQLVNYSI